jgi:thiamine biosynthesis lipoprotein
MIASKTASHASVLTPLQLDSSDHRHTRSFLAMGCRMSLIVETPSRAAAERALDRGRRLVEEAEQCLSRFRPDSELSRLNARAGSWTDVSPCLLAVLGEALTAAELTSGLCIPTVLDALVAAGYDRDFSDLQTDDGTQPGNRARADRSSPGDGQTEREYARPRAVIRRCLRPNRPALSASRRWRAIRLDHDRARVWVPAGCRLDLAGVAKGWTADRVADLLVQTGPCLVDAGGDIAARGAPRDLGGWAVAVADPRAPDDDLDLVILGDAGLATSGTDYRRWRVAGRLRHHLIDSRTGQPSRTDVLTASIIARTTVQADVLAKTVVLLGARKGLAYLVRERLAGLIVRQDGRVFVSPRWRTYACRD